MGSEWIALDGDLYSWLYCILNFPLPHSWQAVESATIKISTICQNFSIPRCDKNVINRE
jgi:hypothetical protein